MATRYKLLPFVEPTQLRSGRTGQSLNSFVQRNTSMLVLELQDLCLCGTSLSLKQTSVMGPVPPDSADGFTKLDKKGAFNGMAYTPARRVLADTLPALNTAGQRHAR